MCYTVLLLDWWWCCGFCFHNPFCRTLIFKCWALFNSGRSSSSFGFGGVLLVAVAALRCGALAGGGMLRAFFAGSSTGCSTFTAGLMLGFAVGVVGPASILMALGAGAGLSLGDAASIDGSECEEASRLAPTCLNYKYAAHAACTCDT